MSRARRSPLSENTIQNLVENDYLSDGECNYIQSSSEEPVDDTDSDPMYEPNFSTASSTSNVRSNMSVLSSDSEDEYNVDNPKPGPSNSQAPTRPRPIGRPSHQRPTSIFSSDTDSEPSDNDGDGWEDVVENNDPGHHHNFRYHELPGPKHCPPRNSPPIDYFDLFFSFAFLNTLATQTNNYARYFIDVNRDRLSIHSRCRNWRPVSFTEIKAFIAVLLNMGLNKKPTIELYWSTKNSQAIPWFGKMFARNRFESILKFFHIVDTRNLPKPKEPGYDPCARFSPLVDHANSMFRHYYTPNKQLSIDESLVGTKNHTQLIQYLPNKHHHKWGIKLWMICDSVTKYCLGFTCYKGAKGNDSFDKKNGLAYNVVVKLLEMCNYLNKGFHVFVDNFFTSLPLAKFLYSKFTHITGTLRSNRKGIPQQMKTRFAVGEKRYCRKGTLLMLGNRQKASQKKPVLLLSTDSTASDESKSKKKGNKVFITSRPKMIRHYNSFMGGVDTADQMLYCYLDERRTIRYWKKVAFHIFSRMIVNLYILYKMNTDKPISRLEFKISIIEAITEEWLCDPTPVQHIGFGNEPLNLLPEKKERNCSVCSAQSTSSGGKRKKTRYACKNCNKGVHPLCLTKHRC